MGLDLKSILGSGITEAVKKVSDVAHTWITTGKDKEEAEKVQKEFELKVQEVLNEQINKQAEIAQKELEIYIADTQDARASNVRIQESSTSSWLSQNTLYMVALLVTVGFFGLLGYMLSHPIPDANKDLMNIMLGSLGTAWTGGVISFFFGSSMGAVKSGDAIRDIARKNT